MIMALYKCFYLLTYKGELPLPMLCYLIQIHLSAISVSVPLNISEYSTKMLTIINRKIRNTDDTSPQQSTKHQHSPKCEVISKRFSWWEFFPDISDFRWIPPAFPHTCQIPRHVQVSRQAVNQTYIFIYQKATARFESHPKSNLCCIHL